MVTGASKLPTKTLFCLGNNFFAARLSQMSQEATVLVAVFDVVIKPILNKSTLCLNEDYHYCIRTGQATIAQHYLKVQGS